MNKDGVPEVLIHYYLPAGGDGWYDVFQFGGNSFEKVGSYTYGDFDIDEEAMFEFLDLKPLPEFDCSDIVEAIKRLN